MSDSIGYSFPTNINTGHIFQNLSDGGTYRFLGTGDSSVSTNWMLVGGELKSDPDTSNWTSKQAGARWFNTTQSQYKGWNGIQIVILG